ncbi:hypothetical protein D9757_003857 [Collybiopsis confluens]|uniref:Uncharacterized protein n=1 Tax=Collybiopsis confluens TaxID=2823264 RepID=A0A8H5MDT6_9AGAR|nr:hypothetical protein D9757_003857 [Collybiopsis confluens]
MKYTSSLFVLAAAAVSVNAVANNAQAACQGLTKLGKHSASACKFKTTDPTTQQTKVTEGFCIPNPGKKSLLHPNGQLECQPKDTASGVAAGATSLAAGAAPTSLAAGAATTSTGSASDSDSGSSGTSTGVSTTGDAGAAPMRRRGMEKRRLANDFAEYDARDFMGVEDLD